MDRVGSLKCFNLVLFTISAVLFLTSAVSNCWVQFRLFEKNSSAAFHLLPKNVAKPLMISANIRGKMSLFSVCIDVTFSNKLDSLKGCYSYNDKLLPLPNQVKSYFTQLPLDFDLAFGLLIAACIAMVTCILLQVKKYFCLQQNNVKYLKLAMAHMVVAVVCNLIGIAAIIIISKNKVYHMKYIHTDNLKFTVQKNFTAFLFWFAEVISILSTFGCVAEILVWKKNKLPFITSSLNNFDNKNFDELDTENHAI